MKQKLIDSIKSRLPIEISVRNPLKYLKGLVVEEYIDSVISTVYLYTRSKKGKTRTAFYLSEVISAIGHNLRDQFRLRKDSRLAARTGAFILYSFEELGMIEVSLGSGTNGHNIYLVKVTNEEALTLLWNDLPANSVTKLPSLKPYSDWTSTRHSSNLSLIKTQNKTVLERVTPDTHPIIFNCVNKAQRVGWRINRDVHSLQAWALRNKADAFNNIWQEPNPEAKTTRVREAKAISQIASKFIDDVFYHAYYYDFRGRKYVATAYLHEQGSDTAKGLLLRGDSKPIGRGGFFWLLVWIASTWAGDSGREDGAKTDKISLKDRYLWTLDNEDIILSYATNPKINQGWMKADKPWQFIAACLELKKVRDWQGSFFNDYVDPSKIEEELQKINVEPYDYESHLECYIDGSTNGSQHLCALTRDEVSAPHVNLVPQDLPGDLYKYVADHVWERLNGIVSEYTKDEIKVCENYIDNLIELKKQTNAAEAKSNLRQELVEEIKRMRNNNPEVAEMVAPVYWTRIKDAKQRRKVVKR